MRRVLVVAAFILGASCGGMVTSPSVPAASSSVLPAGAYTMTLNDSAVFTCQNGICTSLFMCVGPAPAQPPVASIPVTVQRDGDRATVVPDTGGSLRVTLLVGASSVTGNISGTTTTPAGAIVTATGTIAASVSTVPAFIDLPQGTGAAGMLQGQLSIGGTSCSNPTHNWGLMPR